jgi:parallel beta-helix repeat protein
MTIRQGFSNSDSIKRCHAQKARQGGIMLKYNQRRPLLRSCLLYGLMVSSLLFSSCGGGGSSGESSSGAGSVSFNLDWQQGFDRPAALQSPSGDICEDYSIENIETVIENTSDIRVASATWQCSEHTGTISGVPAGTGLTLTITGIVAGNPVWQNQPLEISVRTNQDTNVGTVVMSYNGADTSPPTVLWPNPIPDATDVSLNSRIFIKFSEDVIPTTVQPAFTLFGLTMIDGQVDYDPSSRTATFTPAAKLIENTQYTINIAAEVQDRAGHQMARYYTSKFTTGTVEDITPPTVPNLLSVTAASDQQIDLSWEAAEDDVGVMSYRIYRNGDYVTSVSTTSTTDTNLNPDTQYCYMITALDAAGKESGMSNEICLTTPLPGVPIDPPVLRTPVDAAELDNNCDDLSDTIEWSFDWSDVENATKYQLYVIRAGAVSATIDTEVSSSGYKYSNSDTYIPNATRLNWTWKVRAGNNEDKWSEWSEVRYFDVEPQNTDLAHDIRVPADQPTIQQGIDAASEGTKVVVSPGVYNENIRMKSGVDVIAEGPGTSIVGNADVSGVVEFSDCRNATLDGFEITVSAPDPGVDRGIVFTGSLTDETAVLQNCFLYHTQYGIDVWSPATPTIQNNTLVGEPDEQGIYIGNSATAPIIRNNIITGYSFAGIHVVAGTDSPTPVIAHNNLWNNDQNYHTYPDQTGISGNISENPVFISAGSHNFHLSASSNCIDVGTSEGAPDKDIDREGRPKGGGFDIGADEF